MSIRQDLQKAAARAADFLGDSTALVVHYLSGLQSANGGFVGRSAESDLYYTAFAVQGLYALAAEPDTAALAVYLKRFADVSGLDFVHLACLARCLAFLPGDNIGISKLAIAAAIENYRTGNGGYNAVAGRQYGSAYGCFFALGAYEDLGIDMPDRTGAAACIDSLKKNDGSYVNDVTGGSGSAPATAAALMVLHSLGQRADRNTIRWLLSNCFRQGGFCAAHHVPCPDLLSTATVLHALAAHGAELSETGSACLDFTMAMWNGKGAFFGSRLDAVADCEYTYYGLLALGHIRHISLSK